MVAMQRPHATGGALALQQHLHALGDLDLRLGSKRLDVDQREVQRSHLLQLVERLLPVPGLDDLETGLGERPTQDCPHRARVVYDECFHQCLPLA